VVSVSARWASEKNEERRGLPADKGRSKKNGESDVHLPYLYRQKLPLRAVSLF
jgi:hypothetical protein